MILCPALSFRFRPTVVLAALLIVPVAHVAAAERYVGSAYARSGGKLLYREVHFLYQAEGESRQLVVYQCPGGKPFARKVLHDSPHSAAPDFDFVDARSGYREGVRGKSGSREVYVRKSAKAQEQSKPLQDKPNAVIDAGFDSYVRQHWSELDGSSTQVAFLLPSRLGYMDIKLTGAKDTREQGQAVRKLHMKLDAWYGFAAPAIDLTYSSADKRLRRFEGIGTIRDGSGDNQDVRIEFPAKDRQPDVPSSAVDEALSAPLAGRCDS